MIVRVGVVSSSAGHSLREFAGAVRGRGVELEVVTDRPCGAEAACRELELSQVRIEDPDRVSFSGSAAAHLQAREVDFVLLTFNRIVSAELYGTLPTFNIHPSLLPAFPGFGALAKAFEAGVRFIGATLHLVTAHVDGGPIVAQVCAPTRGIRTLEELADVSFVQRIHLALLAVELAERKALAVDPLRGRVEFRCDLPATQAANPALADAQLVHFLARLERRMQPHTAAAYPQGCLP